MRSDGAQLNNDGVLFSSVLGERRPSPETDDPGPGDKRVCDAGGREVSALLRTSRHGLLPACNTCYLHFVHRHEHEEKVKYIPVVKEVKRGIYFYNIS